MRKVYTLRVIFLQNSKRMRNTILLLFSIFLNLSTYSQINSLEQDFKDGKYKKIIDKTEVEINKNEANFELWYYRGLSQQALFQYGNSIKSFEKAISLTNDTTNIKRLLSESYEKIGDIKKSINIYESFLKTDSLNIITLNKIAQLYKANSDYIKAMDIYTRLVNIDSLNDYFYQELGNCTSKIGLETIATGFYLKSYQLNNRNIKSLKAYISGLMMKQTLYDSAERCIDTSLEVFPKEAFLFRNKGFLYAIRTNYLSAIETFKKTTELGDTSLFTCKYYGQSLYENGNYKDATYWLGRYLDSYPNDIKNTFLIAVAYNKSYEYEKSLESFEFLEQTVYNKTFIYSVCREKAKTYLAYADYIGYRDSTLKRKKILEKLALNYLKEAEMFVDAKNYSVYSDIASFYHHREKNTRMALYYYEKYYKQFPADSPAELTKWIRSKITKLKEDLHFE